MSPGNLPWIGMNGKGESRETKDDLDGGVNKDLVVKVSRNI